MTSRYRTKLVLKIFPSVPKGNFGSERVTRLLERHLFYREFQVAPWKLAYVAVAAAALAAWSVLALALSLHAVLRAQGLSADLAAQEVRLEGREQVLRTARRDAYLMLSRLDPLDRKVDQLSEFSRRLAVIAGIDELADQLAMPRAAHSADLPLSEQRVAELDRRFARLGSFLATQEVELARTPSISPLKEAFVPTDRFGYRVSRFLRQSAGAGHGGDGLRFHAGLDLAAPVGTPIHATADGRVHFAGSMPAKQSPSAALYGNFVVLDHGNGIRTVFAHCDELATRVGDRVRRGDVIATVGNTGRSTGPHVHYEVVVNGRPVDPELFVLDVDIPDRRLQVDFDDHPSLVDEVDKLMGP